MQEQNNATQGQKTLKKFFFFAGRLLITVSISVLVMGLLKFFISPGPVLESCTFLRICPFLPHCPFYWHIIADSSLL